VCPGFRFSADANASVERRDAIYFGGCAAAVVEDAAAASCAAAAGLSVCGVLLGPESNGAGCEQEQEEEQEEEQEHLAATCRRRRRAVRGYEEKQRWQLAQEIGSKRRQNVVPAAQPCASRSIARFLNIEI
jgi:hypothetical protein